MIKVERFRNIMTKPIEAEKKALTILAYKIADEMTKKLFSKAEEGWQGWDNVACKSVIEVKLLEHIKKGFDEKENLIDIINLCAMSWNMED